MKAHLETILKSGLSKKPEENVKIFQLESNPKMQEKWSVCKTEQLVSRVNGIQYKTGAVLEIKQDVTHRPGLGGEGAGQNKRQQTKLRRHLKFASESVKIRSHICTRTVPSRQNP